MQKPIMGQEIRSGLEQESRGRLEQGGRGRLEQESRSRLEQGGRGMLEQESRGMLEQESRGRLEQEREGELEQGSGGGAGERLDMLVVTLQDIERLLPGTGWLLPHQLTQSYTLILVNQGEGQLAIGGRISRIAPLSVCCCMPGHTFGIVEPISPELSLTLIRFRLFRESRSSKSWLQQVKDEVVFGTELALTAYSPTQLTAICDSLYQNWHKGGTLGRFRSRLDFQELLYSIAKHSVRDQEDSRGTLERTKAFMDEHYAEELTLIQLAAMAGVSRNYFVDLFKKKYGVSPMDYITGQRMNRAKRLMASSALRLREIARQVGYQDEFYFSRKFKKETGVTPTLYMKSRKRRIAAYSSGVIGYLLALQIIPYAAPLHPKWSGYYLEHYGQDIPVHLSAYRQGADWRGKQVLLQEAAPDLIICLDDTSGEERVQLRTLSPVFQASPGKNWREQLLDLAARLGEESEAQIWLEAYNRKVYLTRQAFKSQLAGIRTAVVRMLGDSLFLHSSPTLAEVFYGDLGVLPAYTSAAGPVYNERVQLADLHRLDADRIMLLVCRESETLANWKLLQEDSAWRELRAVRTKQLYLLHSDPWREYSPIAHLRIIDSFAEQLSEHRPL